MIRINLLGVARSAAKPAGPGPTAARQALILAVSAVIAFGIVGFLYRLWTIQIEKLNKDIAAERREADRLAQIRAENQRYQTQIQQQQRRINTIQTLENSKVGPVDFMSYMGDIVNRSTDLYLLTINPDGARVAIRGQSNSVESIANFIADLKNSGRFQDVQLRQYFEDDQHNRLSFKFNLDCVYKLPPAAPATPQPTGAAAAPARQAGL